MVFTEHFLFFEKESVMTVLQVYLFPETVRLPSAFGKRKTDLVRFFLTEGISLQEARWNGSPDGLPAAPCMVRASNTLDYPWQLLAEHCLRNGHFLFYESQAVGPNGERIDDFEGEFKRFKGTLPFNETV
jgi:hypothetical protein